MIEQAKSTVDGYKQEIRRVQEKIEDTVDQYGGSGSKPAATSRSTGRRRTSRQVLLRPHQAGALAPQREEVGRTGKEVDPAKAEFETAKSEAQLCFDKLEEVEKDLPENVRQTLRSWSRRSGRCSRRASRRSPSSSRR